jgi:hypothetical protein
LDIGRPICPIPIKPIFMATSSGTFTSGYVQSQSLKHDIQR